MNQQDIARIRLRNQHVALARQKTAQGVVAWMGAMQAQDYLMAQWAVGIRLPGSTSETILAALDKGEILRTHLLRPTWHLVSAGDIHWMLALTAPHVRAGMRSRHKDLGLTDALIAKSTRIMEKMLRDGRFRIREELVAALRKAKISPDDNRAAHLLMLAELEGVICSGPAAGGKQTYALLRERVPVRSAMTREEALATLARRYFLSHGPATLQDFVWWSGLPVLDARRALELIQSDVGSRTVDAKVYWSDHASHPPAAGEHAVHVLPAYDELLISYTDRGASIASKDNRKAVSTNGIFRPVVVVDGRVAGIWRRTTKGENVMVEVDLFGRAGERVKKLIVDGFLRYGQFLGKQVHTRL
jgi:hypothetical protein